MKVLEKYGLKIIMVTERKNDSKPYILIESPNRYHLVLSFINTLDKSEREGLLYDLKDCLLKKRNIDEGFSSLGVDYLQNGIIYQFPNVNIDDLLTIPMQDLQEILEEMIKYY